MPSIAAAGPAEPNLSEERTDDWEAMENEGQQAQQDEEEEAIIKITQRMSSLEQTFISYEDPGISEAVENCSKYNIQFRDLSGLEDRDLEVLGIKQADVREKMLDDFAQLPGDDQRYDKYIKDLVPEEYMSLVLKNVQEHLGNLETALCAAKLKLEITPLDDVMLVDKQIYASDLSLRVVNMMIRECERMDGLLAVIKGEPLPERKQNSRRLLWGSLVVGGLVAGGLWALKTLKG